MVCGPRQLSPGAVDAHPLGNRELRIWNRDLNHPGSNTVKTPQPACASMGSPVPPGHLPEPPPTCRYARSVGSRSGSRRHRGRFPTCVFQLDVGSRHRWRQAQSHRRDQLDRGSPGLAPGPSPHPTPSQCAGNSNLIQESRSVKIIGGIGPENLHRTKKRRGSSRDVPVWV